MKGKSFGLRVGRFVFWCALEEERNELLRMKKKEIESLVCIAERVRVDSNSGAHYPDQMSRFLSLNFRKSAKKDPQSQKSFGSRR